MNPENNKTQPQSRQQKIEAFLLDPEKTIFQSLEEFQTAAQQLLQMFEGVDVGSLEQLVGEDGKTPVRGEDYFTEEDLQAIEDFIVSKVPVVGQDLPSVAQVVQYIQREVAKVPRIKGDKGDPGKKGKDGDNGSPDTPAEIIAKLRSLPKNQRLKITDIRGLENVLRDYREALEEVPLLRKALEDQQIVIPANTSSDGGGSGLTQEQVEDIVAAMFTDATHSGITVNYDDTNGLIEITVTGGGGGETNTASNVGTAGVGVFKQKTGVDFEFKKINAGSSKITITDDTDEDEIDIDIDESALSLANIGGDTDDLTEGANKFATAAEKTKLGYITVTQAVDLDTIESRVNDLDAAVVLRGSWDASVGTFPGGGTAQAGDSYIVSVDGTVDSVEFKIGDRIIAITDNASTGTYATNWLKLDYTDRVSSVAGKTGIVTLDADDVAEVTNKRYMTDAQETKLDSVESSADVTDAANVGAVNAAATSKTTPIAADSFPIVDSAASNVIKRVTFTNLMAFIASFTQTFTNKTMIATTNVVEQITTTASSATPTPTGGSLRNFFTVTALAAGATFAAPSGTPANGNKLFIRIKDNGTARTLAYNAIYRAVGVTLPTTTVISKTIYLGCIYNSADSKWDVIAVAQEA